MHGCIIAVVSPVAEHGLFGYMGFSRCGSWALRAQTEWLCHMGLVTMRHVGPSWTRDQSRVSRVGRQILYQWATREAKFRLKLMKVGKTTRPFRYDLSHIPYDYTVKVTNRFNGLDLIDKVPEELYGRRFVTLYSSWWPKPPPRKINATRQNGCLRKAIK